MTAISLPPQALDVLNFWFEELTPEQWWRDQTLDKQITARFLDLYHRLRRKVPEEWRETPRGVLAAVLVLDQFPRNMFRGTAAAFATDAKARLLAHEAIQHEFDAELNVDERLFLYLPFEHSESPADQARALGLISALGNAQYTEFARQHKKVIDRFGRFPQRNAALVRMSTLEEDAFLEARETQW
ncbi:DUF924 family protein [Dichotomicrobium thermohalophilum]|uniref:Uncharacterized protein (DUF924 family) n=1 Tax=Dichotomicrobium thermohalophilum TaxID=933063 RepID=A0A397Q6J2_9HYPH|nr:DUF924 family protein [Dichotomicrobium thermohalophilum]RIA56668.1 uncharacterized protein (DUF924 family) [Dichotomicrobium thermohalophilum]